MVAVFPPVPASTLLAGAILFHSIVAPPTTLNYEFGNGSVQIDNPTTIHGRAFSDPKLLGAGGGGSVWKMTANGDNSIRNAVVKISWARSANSVRNECEVLNVMERYGVTGVERCLGISEYKYDPRRVVIAMEPFVEDISKNNDGGDITSSLEELSPNIARESAIQLSKTMAQMLSARVVTTDIQPLISKSTGNVILIDMTEAKAFQPDHVLTEIDKALVNAFCTEMIGLIPDYLLDDVAKSILDELNRIEMETHVKLNGDFREVLRDLPLKGFESLS